MLFQSGKPLIVHNGLLDLMHLYHHFYSPLPASLETFLADLSDLVKEGGVFDTKVLADYGSREPASYLSYLFGRFEREQSVFHLSKAFPYLSIKYDTSIKQSAEDNLATKNELLPKDDSVCNQYAKHGHCSNRECKQSHDLEKVLDKELKENVTTFDQIKNNTQFRDHLTQLAKKAFLNPSTVTNPITLHRILPKQPQEHQPLPLSFNTHHSAQFDSFMTGYIFARYLHHPSFGKEYIWGEEFFNKLYIIGRDMPLKVEKIPYSNYSAGHKRKWQLVDIKEKESDSSNKK
jgi:target of EGR1 protein 1